MVNSQDIHGTSQLRVPLGEILLWVGAWCFQNVRMGSQDEAGSRLHKAEAALQVRAIPSCKRTAPSTPNPPTPNPHLRRSSVAYPALDAKPRLDGSVGRDVGLHRVYESC